MAANRSDSEDASQDVARDNDIGYNTTRRNVSIKHAILTKMRSKLGRRKKPSLTSFPLVDTQHLVLLRNPNNPRELDHLCAYGGTVFHWSDAIPIALENTNKTRTAVSMHNVTKDYDREVPRFRHRRRRDRRGDDEVILALDYSPMSLSDIRRVNHKIALILRPDIPYVVSGAAALVAQGYTEEPQTRQIEILCRPEHTDWIWSEAKYGGGLVCDGRRDVFGVALTPTYARAVHIIPAPEGFENLLSISRMPAKLPNMDSTLLQGGALMNLAVRPRCLTLAAMADLVADKFICAFKLLPVVNTQPLQVEMDWILRQICIREEQKPWRDAHLPHINHQDFLIPCEEYMPALFELLAVAGCATAMDRVRMKKNRIKEERSQALSVPASREGAIKHSHIDMPQQEQRALRAQGSAPAIGRTALDG